METIGNITVSSEKLLVTDPCYIPGSIDDGNWHGLTHIIRNVKNGSWEVALEYSNEGDWGRRVKRMQVTAPDFTYGTSSERHVGDAGVDSGQMSVMDESLIPHYEHEDGPPITGPKGNAKGYMDWFEEKAEADRAANRFSYHAACAATRSMTGGIVAEDHMAVCSSGFGDGSYPVSVWRDKDGMAVRVSITFIEDDSDN